MTRLPEPDPSGKLCEEILTEGRRRADEICEEARREGGALLATAQAEAQNLREDSQETATREASRRRERLLAGSPIEIARVRAARIEALLEPLREKALRELAARRFDYRKALATLAAEALQGMGGDAFTLSLAPEDMHLGKEILDRIRRPGLSLNLTEDATITGGGLILRDAEGRQVWDNRLPERLGRLWPQLRIPVARGIGFLGAP
ncbi:V-type ATP synthase subunit E [Holophaga foetida]|uniref:V-type ATP synthase subunit E n=1 Tax=Holophaga foetida TaxID=35839 RepID=UPI0002472ABC|nr:V-type ATP synthase subunit E [Holophaga foetida]